MTFAIKECCSLLFCATVVIAATRAHVGLFKFIYLIYMESCQESIAANQDIDGWNQALSCAQHWRRKPLKNIDEVVLGCDNKIYWDLSIF